MNVATKRFLSEEEKDILPFNFPLSSKGHFMDGMRYFSAHIFIFIEHRDAPAAVLVNAIPHKKKLILPRKKHRTDLNTSEAMNVQLFCF